MNKRARQPEYVWEAPFLRADGTVWLKVGYGEWAAYPQDSTLAGHWAHRYASEVDVRPNGKRGRTLEYVHARMLETWLAIKWSEWELANNPLVRNIEEGEVV